MNKQFFLINTILSDDGDTDNADLNDLDHHREIAFAGNMSSGKFAVGAGVALSRSILGQSRKVAKGTVGCVNS